MVRDSLFRRLFVVAIAMAIVVLAVATVEWWLPALFTFAGANQETMARIEAWVVRLDPWFGVIQTIGGVLSPLLALGAWLLGIQRGDQRPDAPPSDRELEALLDDYLKWIVEQYGTARLYGADSRQAQGQRKALADIYTSLDVEWFERERATGRDADKQSARMMVGGERSEPINMEELLSLKRRIAIVGGAGSGKTTYLSHTAVRLAEALHHRSWLDRLIGRGRLDGDKPVPLMAPLRFWNIYRKEIQAKPAALLDEPQRGSLLDFLEWCQLYAFRDSSAVRHLFGRLIEKGNVVLLFDGMDEVVERSERELVRSGVERLLEKYPNHRCLVTSRAAGYAGAPFGEEFHRCDIRPMTPEQIEELVANWAEQLPPLRDGPQQEILRAISEMNEERVQRGQQPVITTPLLVTMVVSVCYNDRTLPKERVKLYDRVVEMILKVQYGLEVDRAGAAEALRKWGGDPDKQREWLAYLAFHLHQGGEAGAIASEERVRKILAPFQADAIHRFVGAMRDRGGLYEPRGEAFQFMHLSFQEFLAADYLADHWQDEAIRGKLGTWVLDGWWREVLLLTIGRLGSPRSVDQRRAFVQALQALRGSPERIAAAGELAATGVMELREPEEELVSLVRQRVAHFFGAHQQDRDFLCRVTPPRRAAAGRALAALGDPREEVMTVAGMQFCLVPTGPFIMGSVSQQGAEHYDPEAWEDESPQEMYDIPYDYWIGRYPVTNAQYGEFVADRGYAEAHFWSEAAGIGHWQDGRIVREAWPILDGGEFKGWRDQEIEPRTAPWDYGAPYKLANHPVVGVTWYEALAFTRWIETCRGARRAPDALEWKVHLPNEPEWEKAARGGLRIPQPGEKTVRSLTDIASVATPALRDNPDRRRRWPWEGDADANRANYDETGIGTTSAVGCFPNGASPYGVEELVGNAWEWTRSAWGEDMFSPTFRYPYDPADGRESLALHNTPRVLRGGAFYDFRRGARVASRVYDLPSVLGRYYGFRVVLVVRRPHTSGLWCADENC